jgi:hypothetical protein
MKVKYINVNDLDTPSFAFIICEENGVQYTPEYNDKGIVIGFVKVIFEITKLVPINGDYEVMEGTNGLYAYYTKDEIIIGSQGEVASELTDLIAHKDFPDFIKNSIENFINEFGHTDRLEVAIKYRAPYLQSVKENKDFRKDILRKSESNARGGNLTGSIKRLNYGY